MRKLVHCKMLPEKKKINGITLATKTGLRTQKLTFWHWCLHLCRIYLIQREIKETVERLVQNQLCVEVLLIPVSVLCVDSLTFPVL